VAYLGEVLTDPLTKNQSLITTIIEVFSNIPREDLKRACSHFLFRREEVIGTKGDFIRLKHSQYPTKQFGAVSLCCYSYLSCYHHFYFHLKTGVNTSRTLYKIQQLKFMREWESGSATSSTGTLVSSSQKRRRTKSNYGTQISNFFPLTLKEKEVADPHSFVRIRIGHFQQNLDHDSKVQKLCSIGQQTFNTLFNFYTGTIP
jgi:hypothetical protein